jgi:hypothetical protein
MDKYLSALDEDELKWFNDNRTSNIHYNVLKKKSNIKDKIVSPLALMGFNVSLNKNTPNVGSVRLGVSPKDTNQIKELVNLYNSTQDRDVLLLIEIYRYKAIGVKITKRYDNLYEKYKLP